MLPPGAVKCGYCGFATPWGAVLSQQQDRANFLQADQAKRQRLAKALGSAKTGMILAIIGTPICCGPLSLIGGILSWRAGSAVKAEGQPRPVTSVIGLVLAIVSMLGTTTVIIGTTLDQRAKAAHLAAVGQRLEGKREAATLDKVVACDLVEEYLAAKGFGDSTIDLADVHCDGAFWADERRAHQPDVRFAFGAKHFTANACLERRSRWFVLQVGEGLSCADLPAPAAFTPPPRKLSEEEASADEEKARQDLTKALSGTAVKAFTDKLAKVRADALSASAAPGTDTVCAKATMAKYVTGNERKKVETVDLDVLGTTVPGWAMLTSDAMRKALDPSGKMEDRAAAVSDLRAANGPLLVVYKPTLKTWPVVHGNAGVKGKDFSYAGGEYTGTLLVYDIDTGARLCQTKLAFENSEAVDFVKSRFASEHSSAKDAVEGDFQDKFEIAATDAIKRAAPDLRLGYKPVE
jgi:hypothetical protein